MQGADVRSMHTVSEQGLQDSGEPKGRTLSVPNDFSHLLNLSKRGHLLAPNDRKFRRCGEAGVLEGGGWGQGSAGSLFAHGFRTRL